MSDVINNNTNLRVLNIDVNSEINPTNIVLYKDNLDYYKFVINLISNNQHFCIPDDTRITLKMDGVAIPETNYNIRDKYLGILVLKISADFFKKNDEYIDTALAHILSIELYSETTFGLHSAVISVPFTVTTGADNGQQNTDSQLGIGIGTTKPTPVMPSPAWNIIQDGHKPDIPVQPDIPDNNNTDSGTHLIFDGGELF